MKLRSPRTRYHLTIKPGARILEVGGEKSSHPQANVVADVYSKYRRSDDPIFETWNHQELVLASENELPFEDNAFDYVICCQVLEHLDDPVPLLHEMSRVAKQGYVEVPSLVNEYMAPNPRHKWVCMELDHKMVMMDKAEIGMDNPVRHFGSLFTNVLNEDSLAFKTFVRANQDIFTVRHEWESDIDFKINPSDAKSLAYFTRPWDTEMASQFYGERSKWDEVKRFTWAFFSVLTDFLSHSKRKKASVPVKLAEAL